MAVPITNNEDEHLRPKSWKAPAGLGLQRAILRWGMISIPVLFLIIFFVFPIGQMLRLSVFTYDPIKMYIPEFTLSNFTSIFTDPYLLGILVRTLRIAFLTTIFCAIFAFPISYKMWNSVGYETMFLTLILLTPLMISKVILAYSFIVILAPNTGLLNTLITMLGGKPLSLMFSETGVVIGLVYANMVFMVLSLHAAMENIDVELLRAARILGGKSYQVFLKVIFPLSLPGLVSGSLIVFSTNVSSFMVPLLIGGRTVPVLATYAYDMASWVLNWPSASAIAGVLVIITGAIILVYSSWIQSIETRLGIATGEN